MNTLLASLHHANAVNTKSFQMLYHSKTYPLHIKQYHIKQLYTVEIILVRDYW